jgi:spermidine/putrescine transport system permease protein
VSRLYNQLTGFVEARFESLALLPGWILVVTALTGSLSLLVLYSVLETVPPEGAYEFTLDHYRTLWDSVFHNIYRRSLWIALQVTLICIAIGYPVSYYLARSKSKYKNLLILAMLLPLWVNIIIKAYSWQLILGERGMINYLFVDILHIYAEPRQYLFTQRAVVISISHVLLPFMIVPLYTSMRQIDTSQVEATKNLGANKINAFLTVVFPKTLPSLGAGSLFVFLLAFGEFPTPAVVGGQRQTMVGNIMTSMFQELNNWGLGSAMAVVFTLIVLLIVLVVGKITGVQNSFGSGNDTDSGVAGKSITYPQPVLVTLNKIRIPDRVATGTLQTILVLTITFMYLPLFVVALLSFSPTKFPQFPIDGFSLQWYAQLIPPEYDQNLVSALWTSIQLGIIAAVGAAVLGTFAVLGMARGKFTSRLFQRDVLSLAFILPMVIPWIVTGIAMLTLFNIIGIQGTFLSLALGHIFLTIPFVFTVVAAQYDTLDESLEEAAQDLGASRLRTLYEVTFPLLLPAIVAGGLFAFSISFDNFTQTFFWSGPGTRTLPVAIFTQIRFSVEPTVNAIGTIIVVFSLFIAFLGERIARRHI